MKGIVWVHSPRRWHQCTSSALPNSLALGQLPALSPTARPHCRAVMEIRPKPWLRWTRAQGGQWGLACSILTIPRTSELSQAPPICLSGIAGNSPYYDVLSTVCTDLAVYFLLTPHLPSALHSSRHMQGVNKCVKYMNRIFGINMICKLL